MPKLTREERETIIRFDDSIKTCDIYTASPTVARRLIKRGYPLLPDKPWGWRAKTIPLRALTFRKLTSLTTTQSAAAQRRGNPNFGKKPE